MSSNLSGTKIILVYKGKVLAFLRDDKPGINFPGLWDLPGGGAEDGEDLLECAYRELVEEFGLTGVELKLIDVEPNNIVDGKLMGRAFGRLTDGQVSKITFGSEGQKYGFFTVDEIEALDMIPHLKRYILNNRQKLLSDK